MTEEKVKEDMTFEEFNKLIDESHDEGCGMCFSYHQYAHLIEASRKVAYLGEIGKEEERIQFLMDELIRLKDEPVDNNIYFLIMQCELLATKSLKAHLTIPGLVLARAKEMIDKKMPTAWVAARAYGWIKDITSAELPHLMDSTDDLAVWQVCLNCMSTHLLSLPNLIHCRQKAYLYTLRALDLMSGKDPIKAQVTASAGVQALMRLQDERALELWHKLPKSILNKRILEQADHLIKYLTEKRSTQYVPVLMEIKQLCENNKLA